MADDKLIAVLKDDAIYGSFQSLSDLPASVIERLKHYFTTYKDLPGDDTARCVLTQVYDVDVAHDIIRRSILDYQNNFGYK